MMTNVFPTMKSKNSPQPATKQMFCSLATYPRQFILQQPRNRRGNPQRKRSGLQPPWAEAISGSHSLKTFHPRPSRILKSVLQVQK